MRAPLKSMGLAVSVLLVLVPHPLLPMPQALLAAQAQTVPDRKAEADRGLKAGQEALQQRQSEVALKHLQSALALYRQLHDRSGEGNVLYNLGHVYYSQQEYRRAISFHQPALVIRRETGDPIGEAIVLNDLGSSHSSLGEKQSALEYHNQALLLQETLGDLRGKARTLAHIGRIYDDLGEKQKALRYLNQALSLQQAMGDRPGEATTLTDIGRVYSTLGEKQKALDYFTLALPLRRAAIDRRGEAITLSGFGLVYADWGEKQTALDYFNQALRLSRQEGDRQEEAAVLTNLGTVYADLGEKQKALEFYNRALPLRRAVGDRGGEATTLSNIGRVYADLGNKQQALKLSNLAWPLSRSVGDRSGEARTFNNIGAIYDSLGDKQKALEFYNLALSLRRAVSDLGGEAATLNNIGAVHDALGEKQKALGFYNQALLLLRAVGDRGGEARTFNNIGAVYSDLGEKQKALEFYNQSLPLLRAVGDRGGEAATLNNIGRVYSDLGQRQTALAFYNQSLPLRQAVGDRQGEATTLNNISLVYANLGDQRRALAFYKLSWSIAQAVGDRGGEATILNNMGLSYFNLGDQQKALDYYNLALQLYRVVGDLQGEANTLHNVGYAIATQKQPQLAIIFLKQAVSKFENLRADLRQLPKATQESYTKTVAGTYRQLADLLLQHDRILEAQQVLDLLKVQELEDYLRNTRSSTGEALMIRSPEAEILKRYGEFQATAIQLGTERSKLSQLNGKDVLSPPQQQRLDQLLQLEVAINQQFNQFIADPTIQALLKQLTADTNAQNINLDALNGLRDDLKTLNAVSLYPLILNDRIELILTTPNTPPLRRPIPVKKAELLRVITAYRTALSRPGNLAEAQQLAQQLHDWLIKPIEPELKQANPQTILYAPDGALRYIPLAALYDGTQPTGKQWLTQRYQIQHITARSLITNFTTPRQPNLKLFAAAFGNQARSVTVGPTRFNFSGIPFTLKEVNRLGQLFPESRILMEQAFSQAATLRQLDSFNVIHLATHGKFVVGEAKNSFILLGNGDTITLPQIQDLSLANVDLIVLSACETGVGDTLGSGTEILGLGYQFQLAGAKAAIASLWQVDDGGTQAMMNVFYKALKAQKTKTAALQIAQQAMIRGEFQSLGITRSELEVQSTRTGKPIPASQLSHPYYWAPFILIGNGL